MQAEKNKYILQCYLDSQNNDPDNLLTTRAICQIARNQGISEQEALGIASSYGGLHLEPFPESLRDNVLHRAPLSLTDDIFLWENDSAPFFSDGQITKVAMQTLPDADTIITLLRDSGLKGRGGGAFPVWKKWDMVQKAPGEKKYIICNADEGEPDSLKDRYILQHFAEAVICGMHLASRVTGAKEGFIYLRNEYRDLFDVIQSTSDKLESIWHDGLSIRLFFGTGSYICGEESVLLSSIEGTRGEVAPKPFIPAISGLYGHPTLVNNIESFFMAANILLKGTPSTFRFATITGSVKKPGVFFVDEKLPVKTIIEKYAGGFSSPSIPFLQLGGISGPIIPIEQLDDTAVLMGTGSIFAAPENCTIEDYLMNSIRFFSANSCGFCTPCREGLTQMMLEAPAFISKDKKSRVRILRIAELLETMSNCGLGRSAGTFVRSLVLERLDN